MFQVPTGKLKRLTSAQIVQSLPFEITLDDKVVAIVLAPGDTPPPPRVERSGHFPPRRV